MGMLIVWCSMVMVLFSLWVCIGMCGGVVSVVVVVSLSVSRVVRGCKVSVVFI